MKDHDILDANTVQANTIEDPEDGTLTINDDLKVSGGDIYGTTDSNLVLHSDAAVYIDLDDDNDGSNRLNIRDGSNTVVLYVEEGGTLRSANDLYAADVIRAEGYSSVASGEGVELGYLGGVGYVTAYNRTGSTYEQLVLRGTNVVIELY